MKSWVVKAMLLTMVVSVTATASAREMLDLSKALSASNEEQISAERASKKKNRGFTRRPASDQSVKRRIVIDTSTITK